MACGPGSPGVIYIYELFFGFIREPGSTEMTGFKLALTASSKVLRKLEKAGIKLPNDVQLTRNNYSGFLITKSTRLRVEAAPSLLASWHLLDAIRVKPEALVTDPV
jgi:hypothetical protein